MTFGRSELSRVYIRRTRIGSDLFHIVEKQADNYRMAIKNNAKYLKLNLCSYSNHVSSKRSSFRAVFFLISILLHPSNIKMTLIIRETKTENLLFHLYYSYHIDTLYTNIGTYIASPLFPMGRH